MNITSSRDRRDRHSSVSTLKTFFEACAEQSKLPLTSVHYGFCYFKNTGTKPKTENARCSFNKNNDIDKLKDGHLVSDRRRIFESNLANKPKNDEASTSNEITIIDESKNSKEEESPPIPPDRPTDVVLRQREQKPRYSLEDVQKVRRSVMDSIIKYIQEGVSESEDDEEEEDGGGSLSQGMAEGEVKECEDIMKELSKSWSHLNLNATTLSEEDAHELQEDKSDNEPDANRASSEIARCMEDVSGQFNDLVALTEEKDVNEVLYRRSGNFAKNNRSSSKRKKMRHKPESVEIYTYARFNSNDSTNGQELNNENTKASSENISSFARSSFASSSAYESDDECEDIFGTMTEIDEFIVEACNKRTENVLYKLTLRREPVQMPSCDEANDSALDEQVSVSPNEENGSNPEEDNQIENEVIDYVREGSPDSGDDERVSENTSLIRENSCDEQIAEDVKENGIECVNVSTEKSNKGIPVYENVIVVNETDKKETHIYENWVIYDKTLGSYCDKDLNPRITITCESSVGTVQNNATLEVPNRIENQVSTPSPKKQHIIDELKYTEKKYLEGLEYVIHEYLKHFMNHPDVRHVGVGIRKMFGNIEDIFKATENFYNKLLDCEYSVERIAKLFIENEKLFLLCSDYMRNKFKTQHIYEQYSRTLSERQRQLNDKRTCDSYLLTPVQRPTRYKLLLESLCKDLKKHGEPCEILEEAIEFIDQQISEANRLLAIDSIRGCPVDLTSKGPLILKDSFNIKRKYRGYIFLFRDILVFTSESKTRQDTFEYRDSILTLDLSLKHDTNSTTFVLINFPIRKKESPKNDDSSYTFEVEAANSQVCNKWVTEITKMLWTQLTTYKNLQAQKSFTEIESPVIDQKLYHTLPSVEKKKKISTNSTRTSVFYIAGDDQ